MNDSNIPTKYKLTPATSGQSTASEYGGQGMRGVFRNLQRPQLGGHQNFGLAAQAVKLAAKGNTP